MDFRDVSRRPRGRLQYRVFRGETLIEEVAEDNLIVVGSQYAHAQLLGGAVTGNSVTQIGFGTNGTAAAFGNTTLTGAFTKLLDTVTYPAANQVSFGFSLGASEANGLAISEFGLFTAANGLYARRVRSAALNKASDISISGSWVITF